MKVRDTKKGFTLIELMVVISIIALLSSIVLTALNSSKAKAGDVALKSNLDGILATGEMQLDTKGCYARNPDTCATTTAWPAGQCPAIGNTTFLAMTVVNNKITKATSVGGGLNACSSSAGGTAWAIVVQYKTDLKKAWCIDSTGKKKEVSDTADYTQTSLNAEIAGSVCVE